MTALDFPASPTVGQKYPSPAVAGVPVYSWDGEKWTTLGGAIGSTGASDVIPQPDTGTGAAGSSTLWSRGDHAHPTDGTRVAKAGDTMTGFLTLSDNPTAILHAATKQYVDGGVAGIPGKVSKAGDTMTGPLVLPADPTLALQAATKQYVDAAFAARFQRIALSGLKQVDIQVPAGAVAARIIGTLYTPTTAMAIPLLQLSVAAGVFRNTAGDYTYDGFTHNSTSTPTNVAASVGLQNQPGMLLANGHQVVGLAVTFNGVLTLRRPSTGNFNIDVSSCAALPASGSEHGFFNNYLNPAAAGAALNVLALRFINNGADNYAAESYINLEWL
jgi:hypothetical protein